jgi:hypothetical protein
MTDYQGMIIIHGDLYKFSDARDQLISPDGETILALSDLECNDGHYRGLYNCCLKNFCRNFFETPGYDEEDWVAFAIPRDIVEKGHLLSDREITAYNQMSIEMKKCYYLVDKALSDRFNGKLPEIRLDGLEYIIDSLNLEIRQKDNPCVKFKFSKEDTRWPSEALYDQKKKTPIVLSPHCAELPKNIIVLYFPPLIELDPVGCCLLGGTPQTWLVSYYRWNPIDEKIHFTPLSKTGIPELIRNNQLELKLRNSKRFLFQMFKDLPGEGIKSNKQPKGIRNKRT